MVQITNESEVKNTQTNYTSFGLGLMLAGIVPVASIGVSAVQHGSSFYEAIPNTHFWHEGPGISEYGVLGGLVILVANVVFHRNHNGWSHKTSTKTKKWSETVQREKVVETESGWTRN
jgi:hypothetical protein